MSEMTFTAKPKNIIPIFFSVSLMVMPVYFSFFITGLTNFWSFNFFVLNSVIQSRSGQIFLWIFFFKFLVPFFKIFFSASGFTPFLIPNIFIFNSFFALPVSSNSLFALLASSPIKFFYFDFWFLVVFIGCFFSGFFKRKSFSISQSFLGIIAIYLVNPHVLSVFIDIFKRHIFNINTTFTKIKMILNPLDFKGELCL